MQGTDWLCKLGVDMYTQREQQSNGFYRLWNDLCNHCRLKGYMYVNSVCVKIWWGLKTKGLCVICMCKDLLWFIDSYGTFVSSVCKHQSVLNLYKYLMKFIDREGIRALSVCVMIWNIKYISSKSTVHRYILTVYNI